MKLFWSASYFILVLFPSSFIQLKARHTDFCYYDTLGCWVRLGSQAQLVIGFVANVRFTMRLLTVFCLILLDMCPWGATYSDWMIFLLKATEPMAHRRQSARGSPLQSRNVWLYLQGRRAASSSCVLAALEASLRQLMQSEHLASLNSFVPSAALTPSKRSVGFFVHQANYMSSTQFMRYMEIQAPWICGFNNNYTQINSYFVKIMRLSAWFLKGKALFNLRPFAAFSNVFCVPA